MKSLQLQSRFLLPLVFMLIVLLISAGAAKAGDILIPINFPDFLVGTPSGPVPELGHAGILLIRGSDGLTKYYEYGRYDPPQNLGLVRVGSIPNVQMQANGKPTDESLKKVLKAISEKSGGKSNIAAAFIPADAKFVAVNQFAENRFKQNSDPERKRYNILTNNCMHFVKDALSAANLTLPSMVDPRPNSYIGELRDSFMDLDYDFKNNTLKFGT